MSILGPYRILQPLGKGTMGEVYLAEHTAQGHRVALKLLAAELVEDEEALERFEREMETLTQVNEHPGIVGIEGTGRTQDGRPYYAMEYVEGSTLRLALRSGLPLEGTLDLLEQVAEALEFAHQRGLVHRDVKPDNILVGTDGRARLTDFGLAKALLARKAKRLTRTGEVLGTPAYMAPEQVNVSLGDVGPWSDVFALGAILYEQLGGAPPYTGQTAIEIYTKLMEAAPPQPLHSERAELEGVCLRAVDPKPSARYPHAGAFLKALRTARRGIEAGTPPVIRILTVLAVVSVLLGAAAVALAVRRDRGGAAVASKSAAKSVVPAKTPAHPGEAAAPPAEALPPPQQARRAAWAGDAEGFQAALQDLSQARRRALRWQVHRLVGGVAPAPVTWSGKARGWEAIAQGEQALGQGAVGLAALCFGSAVPRGSDDEGLKLDASLGLMKVSIARARLESALHHWKRAWLAAKRVHPLARARCLGWAALLDVALGERELEKLVGGPPLTLAAKGPHHVPRLRRARLNLRLLEGGAPVSTTTTIGHSQVVAERAAFLSGREGPSGLAAARGIVLAELAERGNDRPGAERALVLLEAASRLRPYSPAVWSAVCRAALVLRRAKRARWAVERALKAWPNDPELLLLRARVREAELEPRVVAADDARAAGKPQPALELEVAWGWRKVVEACREALQVQAGRSLRARARLRLARAHLHRARRLRWAGRGAQAAPQITALWRQTAKLVAGVDVARIVSARAALASAVVSNEPGRVAQVELGLLEAGARATAPALAALRLRAAAGHAKSAQQGAAWLALVGDLPARARLALRRAEAASELRRRQAHLDHGLKLMPRDPELLLARECLKLDPETVGGFGQDAESLRNLARVAEEAPEWTGLVLGALGLRPLGGARAQAALAALPKSAHLARALLLFRAGRSQALRFLAAASRACQAQGAVAAHLLHAIGLTRASGGRTERVRPELEHALRCAQAGAPWASVVPLTRLHAAPNRDARPPVDRLLAHGFLSDHEDLERVPWGASRVASRKIRDLLGGFSRSLKATNLRERKRTLGFARSLEEAQVFPRCALALRLQQAGRTEEAFDEQVLGQHFKALAKRQPALRWGVEALFFYELRIGKALRGRKAELQARAVRAARRALREGVPAGSLLARPRPRPKPRLLGAPELSGTLARLFPRHEELWNKLEARARSEGWLRLVVSERRKREGKRPPVFEELQAPWTRTQAILAGLRSRKVQFRAAEWLLDAGKVRESRLALDRALAFSTSRKQIGRDAHEHGYWRLRWRGLEPKWWKRPERLRMLRMALGLVIQAQPITDAEQRPRLEVLRAELALDLAGLSPPGSKLRSAWARRAAATLNRTPRVGKQVNRDLPLRRDWCEVRLLALQGERKRARKAWKALRDTHQAWRKRFKGDLKHFIQKDPLRPELNRIPPITRFLERLREKG